MDVRLQALEELKQGRALEAISQQYDIHPRTLQRWKVHGVPKRAAPKSLLSQISDDTKVAIIEAYTGGTKLQEIKKRFGVYNTTLYPLLREMGIPLRNRKLSDAIKAAKLAEVKAPKAPDSPVLQELPDMPHFLKAATRRMQVHLLKLENDALRDMYCRLKAENMQLIHQLKQGSK